MIGIGVGIDYALLILTRYRAALARGLEPREAAVEAIATAGRSVLVAGTTVVISLLGLFLMGLTYLHGVALSRDLRRARRHGGVGDAAAGAARLRRARGRPAADPGDRPRRRRRPRRDARRALEPRRAAPPVDGRARRRRACCSCSPRRSPGCSSASPTPATTARRR